MKWTTILGCILLVSGIFSLAYFASPIRLMLRATFGPHRINFLPLVLGGLALVCGIVLLLAVRPRTSPKK